MKIDYIIDYIYKNKIIEIKDDNEKIKIKELVLKFETDILFTINFDLEYDLPFNYIKNIWEELSNKILDYINKNKYNKININNINNNIINNEENTTLLKSTKENILEVLNFSFLFPFFLYYNSATIALSCLNIVFIKLNIKLNIIDIISNHKEMEYISIDDIEVCSSLIDKIVLSKIRKKNNELQANNINNINMQNIVNINNTMHNDNELKLKKTEPSKIIEITAPKNHLIK